MSDNHKTPNTGWFQKGNRKVIALVTGSAIVIGGVFGFQAMAASNTFQHMKAGVSFMGGPHGRDHQRFGEWSDADIESRIGNMVKHLAIEIDASDDQQEAITALATTIVKDLKPVHERMRAAGSELHELLVADTIDRDALEQLRAERLADAELISKTLVSALADAAEVLSPEQREMLDARIGEFRSMRDGGMGGGHRGWHRG